MTDAVKIALIVAAGPVLISLLNLLLTRKISNKVENVHTLVNGRLDQALKDIEKLKGQTK